MFRSEASSQAEHPTVPAVWEFSLPRDSGRPYSYSHYSYESMPPPPGSISISEPEHRQQQSLPFEDHRQIESDASQGQVRREYAPEAISHWDHIVSGPGITPEHLRPSLDKTSANLPVNVHHGCHPESLPVSHKFPHSRRDFGSTGPWHGLLEFGEGGHELFAVNSAHSPRESFPVCPEEGHAGNQKASVYSYIDRAIDHLSNDSHQCLGNADPQLYVRRDLT